MARKPRRRSRHTRSGEIGRAGEAVNGWGPNEAARFHDRSVARGRNTNGAGTRAGEAAPDCDRRPLSFRQQHQRYGSSRLAGFFGELRRAGDIEGQNLTVERYSGEGRPEGYADLAREVVNRKPEVIVATNDAVAKAARAATGTVPIVWIGGDPIQAGLATSLARPGGNITGVTVYAGTEIWGKRLQILKEAVPRPPRPPT
jgi:hypothetical protein